jgi:hypothetical protein
MALNLSPTLSNYFTRQAFLEHFSKELYTAEAVHNHLNYNRESALQTYASLGTVNALAVVDGYEQLRIEETMHWCDKCDEWLEEETEEYGNGKSYCKKHFNLKMKRDAACEDYVSEEDAYIDAMETKYDMLKDNSY